MKLFGEFCDAAFCRYGTTGFHRVCFLRLAVVGYFTIFGFATLKLGIAQTPNDVPLEVVLGDGEPMPSRLYLFNADMATEIAFRGVGYDSPQFEDTLKQLRPQGLRFPGGTLANNYQWRKDGFSSADNDKTGWAAEHIRLFQKIGLPYDLPGFARVVNRNRQIPIWVLNVYEQTPVTVAAFFQRLDELNLDVAAIELANEPYWDGRSFNDVQKYVELARPLAIAIRQLRPEIELGACFAPLGKPANYEVIWNAPLAKQTWYDAVIYHDYYGGQGIELEEGNQLSLDSMLHPESMILDPIVAFEKLVPNKKIWFTEWNVGVEGLQQWKNTGAELQYIAAIFSCLIENRDRISIACFHAICDSQFGAMFINQKNNAVQTHASHQLFEILGCMFDAGILRPVKFEDDDLLGFATQQNEELRLFVLNRGDTEQTLRIPPEMANQYMQVILDCRVRPKFPNSTPTMRMASIKDIAVRDNAVQDNAGRDNAGQDIAVRVPPHSINLFARQSTIMAIAKLADRKNLLPQLPTLSLWYPPHAKLQPKFNSESIYPVDLRQCQGCSLAIVKLQITSLQLSQNRKFMLEFEAKSSTGGGISVKLPGVEKIKENYVRLNQNFSPSRHYFELAGDEENAAIEFLFTKEAIDSAGLIEFRGFHLTELKPPEDEFVPANPLKH